MGLRLNRPGTSITFRTNCALHSITVAETNAPLERNLDFDRYVLAVGSVRLLKSLEFLLALRKIRQVILLDQFHSARIRLRRPGKASRTIRQLDALSDRLDLKALESAHSRQDALAAQRLILDLFLTRERMWYVIRSQTLRQTEIAHFSFRKPPGG